MKLFHKLMITSFVAGTILLGFLKLIQLTMNNQAYVLLVNMDYIPLLANYDAATGSGYLFHYIFCLVSVIGLFYLAKIINLESSMAVYVIVFTVGSGVLYFLTALTNKPPDVGSIESWLFWVVAHALFGGVVGILIKYWVLRRLE